MKVLVTCPPMLATMDALTPAFEERGATVHCPNVVQTMSEDELVDLVPQFDGWIMGDDPASARVLGAGKEGRLRAAVKWGIGVDNVDFEAAEALGIPVANTPAMFGKEVADLAMSYLVALARDTFLTDRGVREGKWPKPQGVSLERKAVALVGFGDIGKNIAKRCCASDMNVIVYDPAVAQVDAPGTERATWPERIDEADFLVFACALNDANRHMLNADVLARVKGGVRIVNVARGGLIDEAALETALRDGRVHAAALDVFESEPLPADSKLRSFDRCILGSHNGSNTLEAVLRASHESIRILFRFLEGRS